MRYSLFTLIFLLSACASIQAPTGGPKDEIPPQLLSTIPKQGQTNYRGSRLILEFDEFLKLKNPKEEIIVTPDIKDIKFTTKKNILTVEFGEKLQDSTTYSFAFREAIQDLNEGNSAEDLNLAFSTGDEIDSIQLRGTVQDLLQGQPVDKYTIALYQSDTFNILKHKPSYFTRSNKKGEFRIQNLKAGGYNVYAFEDKNKNLILDSKSEKFGFVKDEVSLLTNQDSIVIKTIPLDARPIAISGIRALGHFTKVRLNKNLTFYSIMPVSSSEQISNCFSSSQSEIDIFPNRPVNDSTLIKLVAIDSLNQSIDTTFYVKQTPAKSLKEKIKVTISSCRFVDDTQKFKAQLQTTELLKEILADSIYIQADTIRKIPFKITEIKLDTIYRKVTIEKTFERKDSIKWKSAKLMLGKMAFTSIHGDSSKVSSSSISVITPEESAILIIESDQTYPNVLLEILDDRFNSLGTYPHSKTVVIKNLQPATLLLRRIIDSNKNGKWDPGNPILRIPPEEIEFYINPEGKPQIPLRANWEVNFKWNF